MKLLTEKQLKDLLDIRRSTARSERDLARELGINFRMLNRVSNGRGLGTVIPRALGYQPIVMYRRIPRLQNKNGKRK